MRIALIDPSLFTLPYDRALAQGLRDGGNEVSLHGRRVPATEDNGSAGIAPAGDFYPLSETGLMRRAPNTLRLALKGVEHAVGVSSLRRRLQSQAPDAIHFQWLAMPLIDRVHLRALGRIAPLVLTVHDTDPFNGDPSARLQGIGFRAALDRFHMLIVHTSQGRNRLQAMGLSPDRIAVVPHGLLTPIVPAAQPQPGSKAAVTFLLFGKMKPYKGIDLLLEAFGRLPPSLRARARLRIVGQPYMDIAPLHSLIERLQIGHQVDLEPRFVADAELPSLFTSDTVAVFPYREIEASGVLALAMAYGRPVIAARLGGFVEAIRNGVNGRLFEVGDVGGLETALVEACSDEGRMARYAEAMRAAALATPDWRQIGTRTIGVYQHAAALRAESSRRSGAGMGESAACRATP